MILRTSTAPALIIPAIEARRLLLQAQGLEDDPDAKTTATARSVAALIERMGFVQIDTISTVERAHHLILAARLKEYRPTMLARNFGRSPKLFEHWTHDASIIPLKWYAHWRPRFRRYEESAWHHRHLGKEAERIVAGVLERISKEGPLASRDFEAAVEKNKGGWWGWKPHKIALDYLWRVGQLHVAGRDNFHKVYDLTERVIPKHAAMEHPDEEAHLDWACRTALERLGTATAREIAQFWNAISQKQAQGWLNQAMASGEVIPVEVASANSSQAVRAYAMFDVRKRIARPSEPPSAMRILSPFDPVLRDRARALRLFNFDFRFEGFVPQAQRKHGYYVMALLMGDQFVGRVDPKFDRKSGVLRFRLPLWEKGIRQTASRRRAFEAGAEQLANWIGAKSVDRSPK